MNYDDIPLKRVRGLSLTRPWPWSFVNGPISKRIENRSWPAPRSIITTHHITLHAAKSWDEHDREFIAETTGLTVPPKAEHPDSVLFAVCRITRCFEFGVQNLRPTSQDIWTFGPWCWVISDFVELIEPIQCKGARSLWGFHDKQDELARLREVYARSLAETESAA